MSSIKHEVTICEVCGEDLREIEGEVVEQRQVHDIPKVKIEVIEHQIEKKVCPECKLASISKFPSGVREWVEYGEKVRGLVTYLNQYQLIPSQRTQEIMKDVFDCKISEGTIYNQVQKCYEMLEPVEESIKAKIQESEVVHFDETGMRVGSGSMYLAQKLILTIKCIKNEDKSPWMRLAYYQISKVKPSTMDSKVITNTSVNITCVMLTISEN